MNCRSLSNVVARSSSSCLQLAQQAVGQGVGRGGDPAGVVGQRGRVDLAREVGEHRGRGERVGRRLEGVQALGDVHPEQGPRGHLDALAQAGLDLLGGVGDAEPGDRGPYPVLTDQVGATGERDQVGRPSGQHRGIRQPHDRGVHEVVGVQVGVMDEV